jgi:hypothetical protein
MIQRQGGTQGRFAVFSGNAENVAPATNRIVIDL